MINYSILHKKFINKFDININDNNDNNSNSNTIVNYM